MVAAKGKVSTSRSCCFASTSLTAPTLSWKLQMKFLLLFSSGKWAPAPRGFIWIAAAPEKATSKSPLQAFNRHRGMLKQWINNTKNKKADSLSVAFLAVTLVTQEGQLNKGQCPSSECLSVAFLGGTPRRLFTATDWPDRPNLTDPTVSCDSDYDYLHWDVQSVIKA